MKDETIIKLYGFNKRRPANLSECRGMTVPERGSPPSTTATTTINGEC